MSSRPCFCTLCQGAELQSKYKIKQHTKLYGLWYAKKSIEGPSTAKKSKIDESVSISSDSSGSDKDECDTKDRPCLLEEHSDHGPDDYCYDNDLVLLASNQDKSTSAEVRVARKILSAVDTYGITRLKGIFRTCICIGSQSAKKG